MRKEHFHQSLFCLKPILTQMTAVLTLLHFHWLQGPNCEQTQLTEPFAPIKHLMRAFKSNHI